jgi:pyruvate formate lyase activating enzyme
MFENLPKGHNKKKPGVIDFENCDLCGKCAQICYSNAIKIIGKEISVRELEVVKKDYSFYERSGGGVTLSGGNPQHNRISH